MRVVTSIIASLLIGTATLPAQAQQYPTKPVTIIVPFAAGGATDLGIRALAEGLSQLWKQNVIVDNKPGGGTMVGLNVVAKAAPDGYTLGTFTNSFLTNPAVRSSIPYDTFKDLVGIAMVLDSPTIIGVTPSLPINTLPDLINEAKKASTPLSYATPGLASGGHMSGELIQRRTGIKLKHVPYNGTAQAIPDLVSGRVQLVISTWPDIKQYVEAGQLRAVAMLGPNRIEDAPNVPTASETLPGFVTRGYSGIAAPSGLPKELQAKLAADIKTVTASPEYAARLKKLGQVVWYTSLPETATFWKEEVDAMTKIAKEEGIKLD